MDHSSLAQNVRNKHWPGPQASPLAAHVPACSSNANIHVYVQEDLNEIYL
jgi:hypothetical protein